MNLVIDPQLAADGRLEGTQVGRGMSDWYEMKERLGGYRIEVAEPDAIFDYFRNRRFTLVRLKICSIRLRNNRHVSVKCAE